MDSAQLLVTVLGAGGGGAALLALINGLFKWLNGSAGRERDKNTSLTSQRKSAIEERDAALTERDEEAETRRAADEYSSMLKRQLIEAGIEPLPFPAGKNISRAPTKSKYKGETTDDKSDDK